MTSQFADLQLSAEPLGAVSGFIREFMGAVGPRHLLDGFTPEETALLSAYLECFGVPRDSVVLREGDEGDFLAILVTGKALVLKADRGAQRVVHELLPGEIVGEMSLIDHHRRFASCITTEPSDFGVLSRAGLHTLLAQHPRLGNKFLLVLLRLSVSKLRQAAELMPRGLSHSPVGNSAF